MINIIDNFTPHIDAVRQSALEEPAPLPAVVH